jgi:phenol 2-monooxygenase
MQNPI